MGYQQPQRKAAGGWGEAISEDAGARSNAVAWSHALEDSSRSDCGLGMATRALYAAYLSGAAGNSLALFYIGDGIIAGVDVGGVTYDGHATPETDGSLQGVVSFTAPAGTPLITGISGPTDPTAISIPISLPAGFADGRITRIETPMGPLNARFEKIRDLP